MRKNLILLLLVYLMLLCSCSKTEQASIGTEVISYKEAKEVNQEQLNNISAVLMFKSNMDNKEIGDLYIKEFNKDEVKIASNVVLEQHILLNNNDVLYVDVDDNLFIRRNGEEPNKIAEHVLFDTLITASNNSIYYRTYEENFKNNYGVDYKDVLYYDDGTSIVLFDSKDNYNGGIDSYKFSYDGRMFYFINEFGTLCRVNADKIIEKLAGNVSYYEITPDGSTYAYSNNNNRIYVKWAGANKATPLKNIESLEGIYLSSNGLSCVFLEESEDNQYNLMYVTPFSEPTVLLDNATYYNYFNNDYLYAVDYEDNLYGYKMPMINSKTKADDLKSKLDNIEKTLIGADVYIFQVSVDGRGVAFIDSNDGLYISYDFKEPVKLKDDISCVHYMKNALVFGDYDLGFYINEMYNDMNKVKDASIKICDDLNTYHMLNVFKDHIIYSDKNSDIYTYSLKDKSKLVVNNAKDFNLVEFNNSKLYEKSLSIEDIVGCYKGVIEDYESLSYAVEITNDTITTILSNYRYDGTISIVEAYQDGILLKDETGNKYDVFVDEDKISMKVSEVNSGINYVANLKVITEQEFNDKLKNAITQSEIETVNQLINDYYSNGFISKTSYPVYTECDLNSYVVGHTFENTEYLVEHYFQDEKSLNFCFWIQISYNDLYGDTQYGWIYLDTSKLNYKDV